MLVAQKRSNSAQAGAGHEVDDLMAPEQAGDYLGKPSKTLANWRSAGTGPAYFKVGGSIRYRREDLDVYLAGRRVTPRADSAPRS